MIAGQLADSDPSESNKKRIPVAKWLWKSYVQAAIIPLLVVEASFLAVYWLGSSSIYKENVAAVGDISSTYLSDLARREALNIDARLTGIVSLTALFAAESRRALDGNQPLSVRQRARLANFPEGGLYTRDENGTTSSFYSAINRIGPEHFAKIGRLSALDDFMINTKRSEPLIASLYFNTADSYNLIYPYVDSREKIEPRTDVSKFNFYYEADAQHNPARTTVWTDAYIDPAGHGWLVSALAPVWRNNVLEGVVGIDIKLGTIVDRLRNLKLPWGAYAMLVGKGGHIIAMPPSAEADLKLKEMRDHEYRGIVATDTFKPDSFNIAKRLDTAPLFRAMQRQSHGTIDLNLNGPRLASFSSIGGTQWKLVIVAPQARVYADANNLNRRLHMAGYIMLAGLLFFYVIFFVFLYFRARRVSQLVAAPLQEIEQVLSRIRNGQHRQTFSGSKVAELDALGHNLITTGAQLGDAVDKIVQQQQFVSAALEQQNRINVEQTKFIRHISHELRTPLAVIDSAAQILERKADSIEPQELQRRLGKMRTAVKRIAETLESLLSHTQRERADDATPGPASHARPVPGAPKP